MKGLLCRVIGHQRTLVAFTSNRFSCRRCGADLGRDIPVMPTPPAAARTHPTPRVSDLESNAPRERSLPRLNDARGTRRLHGRPRRGSI